MTNLITDVGVWNEKMVREIFLPYEADAILDIPLNRRGGKDIRIWKETENDKYSVKSGYHMEMKCWDPPPFQSCHPIQNCWKLIWSLNIPPKVRIFMWKASRDFIPTAANLLSKHVPTNGLCSLCRLYYATSGHSIFFCQEVKFLWKQSVFWRCLRKLRGASFVECDMAVAREWGRKDVAIFAMMAWATWHEVCKRMHNNSCHKINMNIDWAISVIDNFDKAVSSGMYLNSLVLNSSGTCLSNPVVNSSVKVWFLSRYNFLRLDVDAGFDSGSNQFSVGAVVRDFRGAVLGAMADFIRHSGSVKGAELVAIRFGLDFCVQYDFKNICIFSDSLQAVRAVTQLVEDHDPFGALILEIRDFLASPMFISLQHMPRSTNDVAHMLAREVLLSSSRLEWLHSGFSIWLSDLVSLDLRNLC